MLSIITSLYKSEKHLQKFLRRAEKLSKYLESIRIQHEFIVLPNNPSDKEKEILNNTRLPLKIFFRDLETLYATWNFGIEKTNYDNICFWNVDDIRFGGAIIDGLKKIANGAEIIYFPFIYFRYLRIWRFKILAKIKWFNPPTFDKKRFLKEMHCGPFFMTTKKTFKKVGFFNEKFTVAGDFEWCARAAMQDVWFSKSNVTAGIFTSDGTTLSGSTSERHILENEMIYNLENND